MPRRRLEQRAIESRGVADMLAQQLAAIEFRQERATVKRIDDEDIVVVSGLGRLPETRPRG